MPPAMPSAMPRSTPIIRAIRDIAAHVNDTEPPHIEFRRLVAGGHSAPSPPLFLLGAANRLTVTDLFGQTETPQIGCYVLTDAAVAPTGIAMKDRTAFCSAAFLHPPHHVTAVADRLNTNSLPWRRVPGPLAVIYGPGHETHGHWLTDFMPRLSVLYDCGYDLTSLRFLVPPDLSPTAAALLRLAGIADTQLEPYRYWKEVLHTDLLLMPTCPRLGNRLSPYFAEATRFWVRRAHARNPACASQAAESGTLLFVSRQHAPQTRHAVNRAAIEAKARLHGYSVIVPEQHEPAQQMALFAQATSIVGEYGSGLHNSIFAGRGTAVCALRGNARHPGFIQSGIATVLRQHVGYVLGESDGEGAAQNFAVDPADVDRALDLLALHRQGCRNDFTVP